MMLKDGSKAPSKANISCSITIGQGQEEAQIGAEIDEKKDSDQ